MSFLFSSGSTTNQNSSSSGTSTPTYTPGQSGLQNDLLSSLSGVLKGGPQGIFQSMQPLVTAGTNNINQANDGSQTQMDRYLASRGMGGGGVAGQSAAALESQRLGQVSGLNSSVAGMANQDFYQSLSDALDAAYKNPGNTSTGTSSGSSTTTTNPSIFSDLAGIAGISMGTDWSSLFSPNPDTPAPTSYSTPFGPPAVMPPPSITPGYGTPGFGH